MHAMIVLVKASSMIEHCNFKRKINSIKLIDDVIEDVLQFDVLYYFGLDFLKKNSLFLDFTQSFI